PRFGIGRHKVELIFEDGASSVENSRAAVRKLYDRGAVALVAGYTSSEVLAILDEAQKLSLPTAVPTASANAISDYPVACRASFSDTQQAHVLAAYFWYWRKLVRIAVLSDYSEDNQYSNNVSQAVADKFAELGGFVVSKGEFTENMTDFSETLRKVMMSNPQAIVIPASSVTSARIVRELRELGYAGVLAGPDTWDEPEFFRLCGMAPGECIFTSFYAPDKYSATGELFRRAFANRFPNRTPGAGEVQGYDAMKLLAIGLTDANTVTEFRANLLKIRNHQGAGGIYTMLSAGGIDRTVVLKSLRPVNRPGYPAEPRYFHEMPYSKIEQYEYPAQ
ncbi:MAG: ABC transporter substrate-binding protein, partial [Victivallaceae bacterium]|nr:ABC transporter substrate-binding protein [Victivallaceae bacterium]